MPATLKPVPKDVEVWRVHLDDPDSLRWASDVKLSSDESERAAKFVRDLDRERFSAGRRALRAILSQYAGATPSDLEFKYSKSGKPSLKDSGVGVNFSVTHCEDLMLVAVTALETVGIDTERVRSDVDHLKIAERFFAPREISALRELPADQQKQSFFLCWTRKEAFIKATGSGMSTPLDSFEVSLLPKEEARFLSGVDGWSLRSFKPAEGFVAAVAAPGNGWEITIL